MAHRGRISLVLAALAALTGGVLTTGAADAAAPKPPPTVKVSVTGTRLVHLPGTMRPGLHRFHVTSAKLSNFEIGKPKAGYTKAKFVKDAGIGTPKAFQRTEKNVSLRGGAFSDKGEPAVFYANLARGTYWVYDNNAQTLKASKIKTLKVTGKNVGATAPATTGTLGSTSKNTWNANPTEIDHSGVMRLKNTSGHPFQLVLAKLKDGKTAADFDQWVADGGPSATDPINGDVTLFTGALSPGQQALNRYSLPSGDYMMLSWWPDDSNGQQQWINGMYRGITLK